MARANFLIENAHHHFINKYPNLHTAYNYCFLFLLYTIDKSYHCDSSNVLDVTSDILIRLVLDLQPIGLDGQIKLCITSNFEFSKKLNKIYEESSDVNKIVNFSNKQNVKIDKSERHSLKY